MKPQKPAEGISQLHSWSDFHMFKLDCDCTDPDHSAAILVELDSDTKFITLSFFVKASLPSWRSSFSRVRTALSVLFGGNFEKEHHLILNQQVSANLLAALDTSIKHMESQREKHTSKKYSTEN
jgi:hypothetical protein